MDLDSQLQDYIRKLAEITESGLRFAIRANNETVGREEEVGLYSWAAILDCLLSRPRE
jgi:hypothetical protein